MYTYTYTYTYIIYIYQRLGLWGVCHTPRFPESPRLLLLGELKDGSLGATLEFLELLVHIAFEVPVRLFGSRGDDGVNGGRELGANFHVGLRYVLGVGNGHLDDGKRGWGGGGGVEDHRGRVKTRSRSKGRGAEGGERAWEVNRERKSTFIR